MEKKVWAIPINEVYKEVESSEKGLSSTEADKRLVKYGANEIAKKERKHGLIIFFSQFHSSLIYILIAAAIISFFLGDRISSLVILSIILLNAILGFFQEYKAEKAVRELRKFVSIKSNVLRDKKMIEISSKQIVPGDIVYLKRGDIVPADIRLIESNEISADESSLTGESIPVSKSIATVSAKYTQPQNLQNMIFMGTNVATGLGKGIVISTGKDTFFGKTASHLKEEEVGDFQKSIHKFSDFLFKVVMIMTLFIFAANAFLNRGIATSFLFAVALAVGITPEVLPIIMTITLSKGAMRMAKENVITKQLSSVEDFGNIDVLCCDKTGTLTEGKLSLEKFIGVDGKKDMKLLVYGAICSSVKKQEDISYFDDPIDKAVWHSNEISKIKNQVKDLSVISENDFDFERRRTSVLVKQGYEKKLIVKGAAESVIKVCDSVLINNKKLKISNNIGKINSIIENYEKNGYKTIAVAEKKFNKNKCSKSDEMSLTLLGFLLFLDPPKNTTKRSLKTLEKLDIKVKVITGDSPIVTRSICNKVGLDIFNDKIITGDELESLDDIHFRKYCQEYNVFARISPEQKYKIVQAIKEKGHVVGFLGDGINDAPALHLADVGISVDTATGVAKDAANIILLKKSLRVLAHGVIEGRKTFGNIMKYVLNTISANYGNMFTVALSSLFLKFIPLLPSQILFNNFLSDIPMLTISTDNVDKELLRKPKHWNIKLISRFMIYFGFISSFFDLLLIIPLILIIKAGPDLFRTSWFIMSVLSEIIITFVIRTKLSFLKSRPSKWLILASILTIIFSIIIINIAIGNTLFSFVQIPFKIWLMIIVILIVYFITTETVKKHFFKRFEL